MKRTYWFSSHLGVDYEPGDAEVREIVPKERANLVSSYVDESVWEWGDEAALHMPTLDIDHKCHIRESETPGHYHLLIDVPMLWSDYKKLLEVMADVGILEQGYVKASIERGSTFLARQPWKSDVQKAVEGTL